ncbi:three-prime repair exonuclease 1 [Musca autumnalis]|uniref:three-prime repair exonuclease 1 n=1 Tax=Musca autumnalis TaxID=221902 RepID=UPI003CF0134D
MEIVNTEDGIKSFVVFDLETNGLPNEQFNKCSITELSMYAFSSQCLKDAKDQVINLKEDDLMDGITSLNVPVPELPRVLHKLTLMVNPMRMIHPESERITGLSNDMLCNESPFDTKTANCVLAFLERLEKPICFVAHNGWNFDYPVIRHVFEKIKMTIPSTIYCVDSFKAFIEMDEKKTQLESLTMELIEEPNETDAINEPTTNSKTPLEENDDIDWQKANETTPQRKSKSAKRKLYDTPEQSNGAANKKRLISLKSRRELFSKPFQPQTKYPPKDKYKLGNIFERVFKQPPTDLHRAESDVMILTKLILHHGLDFMAYAEERKEPFDKVKKLGQN